MSTIGGCGVRRRRPARPHRPPGHLPLQPARPGYPRPLRHPGLGARRPAPLLQGRGHGSGPDAARRRRAGAPPPRRPAGRRGPSAQPGPARCIAAGRGEPADLTTVAPLPRERPTVESGRGVQDGDLGAEDLAATVAGRAHPVDLLLHRRNDLVVACQREEPVVGREQQRNAVVREQRSGVALGPAAGREGVEVLTKPLAHVVVVHDDGSYRCPAIAASVCAGPSPGPLAAPSGNVAVYGGSIKPCRERGLGDA
jgi:hypothetical protein